MENHLKELEELKREFHKPYPYNDIDKMYDDFYKEFEKISSKGDGFETNFNTYCFNIAATISYILRNKKSIPQEQIKQLRNSFFDSFKQYKFLEENIKCYKDFYKEYKTFENARMLILHYVSNVN